MAGAHRTAAATHRRARVHKRRAVRRATTTRCSRHRPPATCSATAAIEIVADDMQGNVYAWDSAGQLVFHRDLEPELLRRAARAATRPGRRSAAGVRERTEGGFLTSPVLAKLDPAAGRGLDIIAAGEDRHVYAWHADGSAGQRLPGARRGSRQGRLGRPDEQPAAVQRQRQEQPRQRRRPGQDRRHAGGRLPRRAEQAAEHHRGHQRGVPGQHRQRRRHQRRSKTTTASLGVAGRAGCCRSPTAAYMRSRRPATPPNPASGATGGFQCASSQCTSSAIRPGWPVKIGLIDAGPAARRRRGDQRLARGRAAHLPRRRRRARRSASRPTRAPATSSTPTAAPATARPKAPTTRFETDFSARQREDRHARVPRRRRAVVRHARRHHDRHVRARSPALIRALDVVAPDYQKGGQDFIAGWNANSGQFAPGFPAVNNDLSFITGQAVGDVTGDAPAAGGASPGTASQDLQAYNAEGSPASTAWPKLTGDWLVATPTLGSLGTLDTTPAAPRRTSSRSPARARCRSTRRRPRRARRARGRTSTTTSPTRATTRATPSRRACR